MMFEEKFRLRTMNQEVIYAASCTVCMSGATVFSSFTIRLFMIEIISHRADNHNLDELVDILPTDKANKQARTYQTIEMDMKKSQSKDEKIVIKHEKDETRRYHITYVSVAMAKQANSRYTWTRWQQSKLLN